MNQDELIEKIDKSRKLIWVNNGQPVSISKDWFFKCQKKPVKVKAFKAPEPIIIETLEGQMKANKGDFVICGVKGELYPCKPDIFWETYEVLE